MKDCAGNQDAKHLRRESKNNACKQYCQCNALNSPLATGVCETGRQRHSVDITNPLLEIPLIVQNFSVFPALILPPSCGGSSLEVRSGVSTMACMLN
jgi:hypothetical protein